MRKASTLVFGLALTLPLASPVTADMVAPFAAPGETVIATLHAQGAQVYECKVNAHGRLVWTFREPIATLLLDGRTVGRHYAGPNWEYMDGSAVVARVSGRSPGASRKDIPWLKLAVTEQRGSGILASATTVQRINTSGGAAEGPCDSVGSLLSVPYATDYVFLRRPD